MKKPLIVLLTALAISTSGITMAFADDTTPATTTPATSVSQTVYQPPASDPNRDALKAQILVLKGLRDQEKALNEQLQAQTQTNKGLIQQIKSSVDQSLVDKIKQVNATDKDIRTNQIEPLVAQIKTLRSQLETTTDKDQKAQIRDQIKQLVAQVKPLWDQIKANRQSIQDDINTVKAQRQAAQQAFSAAKPLWENQKTMWAQVKTLDQQKQGLWTTYNGQVKAKDYVDALTTLNQIIGLKQQIITEKQQILANKQQVTTALQAGTNGNSNQTQPTS